jgi:hypothetical protein
VWASRRLTRDETIWIILLLSLCLGNDLLFAVISGPADRYHHRILPLLGLVALVAIAAIQRQHGVSQMPAASKPDNLW